MDEVKRDAAAQLFSGARKPNGHLHPDSRRIQRRRLRKNNQESHSLSRNKRDDFLLTSVRRTEEGLDDNDELNVIKPAGTGMNKRIKSVASLKLDPLKQK